MPKESAAWLAITGIITVTVLVVGYFIATWNKN
jgi:hypothetical protein